MSDLILSAAVSVFSNLIQLFLGCALSILVYSVLKGRVNILKPEAYKYALQVAVFPVAGIIIPLGTYGLLPIVAVLIRLGIGSRAVIPLVVSNAVFNMLVPFSDPGFVWKTGYRQILLAVVMGLASSMLLNLLNINEERLLNRKKLLLELSESNSFLNLFGVVEKNINLAGVYLIVGAFIDKILNLYILPAIINEVFTNSYTSSIPVLFARLDVAGPSFLLLLSLVTIMVDIVKLSAFMIMLRPKGILICLSSYIIWNFLLAVPAFIK